MHHFPAIHETFQEIKRVLKTDGVFFLSDPTPNKDDTERFVDAYMQMKKDGHIKFYTKQEWMMLGNEIRLKLYDNFKTEIRFPRKKQTAIGYADIKKSYDHEVIEGYELEEIDDEIWLTEQVNNLFFRIV